MSVIGVGGRKRRKVEKGTEKLSMKEVEVTLNVYHF